MMISQIKHLGSRLQRYLHFTLRHNQKNQTNDRASASVVTEAEPRHHKRVSRLSVQSRLGIGVLVAVIPTAAILIWLAWETPYLWYLIVICFIAFVAGVSIVLKTQHSLTELVERARQLTGNSSGRSSFLNILRRDAPQVDVLTDALDQIERSMQEIQSLKRIGQLVVSQDSLERILTVIVEEAVALLKADAGLIGSWEPEKQIFCDIAACNMPIIFPGREFRSGESFSSNVAKMKKVLFLEDYSNYPSRITELEHFQFKATLGAPLMVNEQCRGAITILSIDPKRRFSPREGEVLAAFANQAGVAFEMARLVQVAREQLVDLHDSKMKLDKKSDQLEEALLAIVQTQEKERSRIAADVHDGVVQMMIGSLCELQAAMTYFPLKPDIVEAKHKRSQELIRESITELRRVIFDLRPITLDNAGLVPAVEALVNDLKSTFEVDLNFKVSGSPCRFFDDIEIGVYRLIQEAINNAVKHANANSISIHTHFENGMIKVVVQDDGEGFLKNEATSVHGKNVGLVWMKERARSLGGGITVKSIVGEGTTVTAEIPFNMQS